MPGLRARLRRAPPRRAGRRRGTRRAGADPRRRRARLGHAAAAPPRRPQPVTVEPLDRMRNAVCGGQPRRTSSIASCRSTLRSSASTNAASLSKPTAMSCSIRQPRTRATGSGPLSSAIVGGRVSSRRSCRPPLTTTLRGSAPRRTGQSRTTTPPHDPSSRARRAKRYHSIHVVSLCPSPICSRPSWRVFVVCRKVYRQDVRKPCGSVVQTRPVPLRTRFEPLLEPAERLGHVQPPEPDPHVPGSS